LTESAHGNNGACIGIWQQRFVLDEHGNIGAWSTSFWHTGS